MKLIIDTELAKLEEEDSGLKRTYDLYSREAFEVISRHWMRVGWAEKYPYTFSWLGRPIIQLPEDMVRIQEVLHRVKPDVIIETGVAHGGSLVYYASLCKVMGRGRVVGVDIEIRPRNRAAIESHELASLISLVEGNSTDPAVVTRVQAMIGRNERVLVILDSNHSLQHVRKELDAYHHLVSPGSYIVATDGIMHDLWDVPRGRPEWMHDNPYAAALEFAKLHPEFVIEQPVWPFNESGLRQNVTHWPGGWLRRQ